MVVEDMVEGMVVVVQEVELPVLLRAHTANAITVNARRAMFNARGTDLAVAAMVRFFKKSNRNLKIVSISIFNNSELVPNISLAKLIYVEC